MLKWTVGQKHSSTLSSSSSSGSSVATSSSPGSCCPLRHPTPAPALGKPGIRPRARRVSIHQINKENRQCRKSVDKAKQKIDSGETGTPRTRDSVYMRLDSIPAALRDVSNHYSPRLDSAGLSDSIERAQRRRSYSKRQKKSPCSVPSHHRLQRRKSEPPYFIHEDEDEPEKAETPAIKQEDKFEKTQKIEKIEKIEKKEKIEKFASIPITPPEKTKKKQPCTAGNKHKFDLSETEGSPSMQVEYSPSCQLKTCQSNTSCVQKLESSLKQASVGKTMLPPTSFDNPVYFALALSPPSEPDLLLHKELPVNKTLNRSKIPATLLKDLHKVQLEAQSAVKEILLNSSSDLLEKRLKECQSNINKGTPCEVSPLARKLAWLRLNTQPKTAAQSPEPLISEPVESKPRRSYLSSINNNIFNVDSQLDNLDEIKNPNKTNNDRLTQAVDVASKRHGVVFNELTFPLNTPRVLANKENGCGVEASSSIDVNVPSTLKRQKVIRRRRRDTNLGFKEDCESLTKIPRRRVLSSSLLTLPDGIPSPFAQFNWPLGFTCTPLATEKNSFILLDDSVVTSTINENSNNNNNSNSNKNKNVNVVIDSGCKLNSSLEGIAPLGDQTPTPISEHFENDSAKIDSRSVEIPILDETIELTRKKNQWKRKLRQKKLKFEDTDQDLNISSAGSSCSEDTWDSHGMRLKTPRLASNFSPSSSFLAPGSSVASSKLQNDSQTTNISDVSSQQIASSPEVERQSRSRRCLLFASPGSSSRSKLKTVHHGLPWKRIKDKSTPLKAELELALSLQTTFLTVHVKRGKNLARPSGGSPVNAYVKVNLVPSGSEKSYHRTCVRKDSINPKFDQKFIMELTEMDLNKRVLLSVWHRDRGKRRSEFLGCMSFAVKNAAEKEISGSFRLLAQGATKAQNVMSTPTPQTTDVMGDQSESSVEETLSAEENPTPTPVREKKSIIKKDLKTDLEDNLFLRHLELDPPGSKSESRKGGRTPFTTTRKLTRPPGQSFGFSIAWTHPPRVERVELGMPADRAGLRPGDFVVFINKINVVTLPEEDVLSLIKACGNQLTIEVYRKIVPNGTVNRGSTPGPPNLVNEKASAVPPRSISSPGAVGVPSNGDPHSKSRFHLPQITFTTEGKESVVYKLLNIEQDYALCLQFGISRFLVPLAERRDLINQQQHQTLFQNSQELLRLTEDVIEHLVPEDGELFGTNVGLVYFNKMNALSSAYRKYCIGLKKADCLLVEKTRNKEFMRLLSEPPIPRKRPDLTTFLHKPLEHYREVLKQLQNIQNSIDSRDPDYQTISRVVQQFQSCYREMTLKSGLMEPEGDGRPLLSLQDLESRLVFTRCKPFVVSTPGREWIFGGDLSRVEGRTVRSFWALLFSDLLVFAKVSRDRVLFITEEPLQLRAVTQALFNIRKKATEFRLLISLNKNQDDRSESPESQVTGCGLPDFTHTPRKSVRTRSIALRAPTLELKAVWQNLIQRQIIYLNTMARGGTPADSLAETPDSPSEQANIMQELIENRCRQLCRRKSSVKKGSALHLADWLRGRLGGNINADPPSPEEELEIWSKETLAERTRTLGKSVFSNDPYLRSISRTEELEFSDNSRTVSRCTINSQVFSKISPERGMPVCQKCHKTCLVLPCDPANNNNIESICENRTKDLNANPIFDELSSEYDTTNPLSPWDPFNPLPDIEVQPPSPPKRTQSLETEDDSDEGEDLPYQALPPSSNLKRFGTMSSLEKLDSNESAEMTQNDPVSPGQLESVSTYLGGWTARAGSYVADKMSFFEKLGQDSFLDKYLNRASQELPATSTNLACDDEAETASGASGEELWGTPTSGPDSELASPLPDSPSSAKEYDDLEMDRVVVQTQSINSGLTSTVSGVGATSTSGVGGRGEAVGRYFAIRTRLEPLPEDEEDISSSTSSSSPDTSACTQSCPTQQSNHDSRLGAFNSSPGFFHKLKLRRSQSADSQPTRPNKLLEFLSSRRSEDGRSRLMRFFSRESSMDDILTSLPQPTSEKITDKRFWKLRRRRQPTKNIVPPS